MQRLKIAIVIFCFIQITACTQDVRELNWPLPTPDHIVIVLMENHTYDQIMTDSAADYIQSLADDPHAAVFANSYAMGHPSQPNYLQLFSGSNQGVLSNDNPGHYFKSKNLACNLQLAGKTFISYAEDLPYTGFDGDGWNKYVRKHNPVVNWVGENINQVDSSLNQPFKNFPGNFDSLPTICYVIPNLVNDMHDSTIDAGDNWIENNLGAFIEYAKTHNSLFILTFDEGNYEADGDHIFTLILGNKVKGGIYEENIFHHMLLRTLEDMYDLDHAGNASNVDPIYDCWK